MIEKTFVILGLVLFLNQLFEKLKIWEWIQERGSISRSEFIYKLTSCRFCLIFHLSWILTLVSSVFGGFSWDVLIVPFVVSGLTQIFFNNGI
tara:strand:- start:18274 stop:18549 length:276 start_codon:yes stop_codon:yes gene_type:complete